MKILRISAIASLFFILILVGHACSQTNEKRIELKDGQVEIKAQVWADNWFSFYLGEKHIKEDSVPITTERSFNSETFTFVGEYPLTLNFVLKDFKENDTGLEYIGSRRQQMGDGGFIMQMTDVSSGKIVAVSNENFKCSVIHEAPLDKSCEKESSPVAGTKPCEFESSPEPEGWKKQDFDDSNWKPASVFSADQVSPKGGYDSIKWDSNARLIWGDDLESSNTILCRVTVEEK
ncbi:MAG: PEBP family protein [Pyrinomonadaceae bacterium]|nr:PEBP family protein [Pyrinomonadaceae bacterium]